jgi:hypothetical protein
VRAHHAGAGAGVLADYTLGEECCMPCTGCGAVVEDCGGGGGGVVQGGDRADESGRFVGHEG